MRKPLCVFLAVALLLAGIAGAEADDIGLELDRIFKRFSTMGACVAAIENGEVVYVHCYGTAQNRGEPITPNTCFRVGSISKLVTAMGLMKLVENGDIDLDDELGDILGFPIRNPGFPESPITLRQLMTHTAGFRDGGDYNDALGGDSLPLDELLCGERAQYAFLSGNRAGERREYSNFGGGLMGSIIERVSRQSLQDYMSQSIFEPLGITAGYNAASIPEDVEIADMYLMPQRQRSYCLREDDPPETAADWRRDYVFSAGKLIISAPDLAVLLIALCDGGVYGNARVLNESTVMEMTTPQDYRGTVLTETGNGLFMNIIADAQVEGRTMYGHGGKAHGMLCAAYFDPTDRTGVVMLTNGCRNNVTYNGVGMLGRSVMRLIYGELLGEAHETVSPFLVDE